MGLNLPELHCPDCNADFSIEICESPPHIACNACKYVLTRNDIRTTIGHWETAMSLLDTLEGKKPRPRVRRKASRPMRPVIASKGAPTS